MSVSESVSKLESAVNDKNQDQKQITAAYEEVSKLLKDPDSIKEFNKSIADNKNDIGALKGLSLVKIDEQGNMEFSSTNGKMVEFNSQSNFKATTEKEPEKNQSKNVDFKLDKEGKAVYEVGKGDTVWGVAEKICAEKNQGKPGSALEVYNEMNKIIKENPQLKNPDRIKEGRDTLVLPKDSVQAILEARKAAETKKSENKTDDKTENKTENKTDSKTDIKTENKTDNKTDNTTDNKTENKTENKTDNNTESNTSNTPCQPEKMVGPDQRKEFLLQEQRWMFSKGETKDTIFEDIDKDGDRYLTTTEINEYRVNKTIDKQPNHDAYLKELATKREDIEELSNDETWDEDDGITKADLTSWTDSETLSDRKVKELEQKKVEQEQKKAEEEKVKQDAKELLKNEAFFLKASGYDGTISIPDVEKYEKELATKQPANDTEKQQIQREKKALVEIKAELERRSRVVVHPKTGHRTEYHDGVMTQQDSQTWKG